MTGGNSFALEFRRRGIAWFRWRGSFLGFSSDLLASSDFSSGLDTQLQGCPEEEEKVLVVKVGLTPLFGGCGGIVVCSEVAGGLAFGSRFL